MKITLAGHRVDLWPAVVALAGVSCALVLVPFNPQMPATGLDASYAFAMDHGVSSGLVIGRELVFIFGPYSSLYCYSYHPGTYALTLLVGLFLATCYTSVLVLVTGESRPLLLLTVTAVLASIGPHSRDSMFFLYPLLVAVYAAARADDPRHPAWPSVLVFGALVLPFGLFPLVKASLLPLTASTAIALALYLAYFRKFRLALLCMVVPPAGCVLFWLMSGQPAGALADFAVNMVPVILGHTEAMSIAGSAGEIVAYLVSAAVTLWAIAGSRSIPFHRRALLMAGYGAFSLIALKAGFVRHDDHALAAGVAAVLGALAMRFHLPSRRSTASIVVAVATWYYIGTNHGDAASSPFANLRDTYTSGLAGLGRSWRPGWLNHEFQGAIDQIRLERAFPAVQGTADIYSFNQAYLLASGIAWRPRPAFQSATAYTPSLAEMNERHLRQPGAPDRIFFRMEPIDHRFPSLEDGPSWPALLDNYRLTELAGDYAYLAKNETTLAASTFTDLPAGTYRIGEEVTLPPPGQPLFATIDVRPTWLGLLARTVFKIPNLSITVTLRDGTTRTFRAVSGMMKAGFFISPLIENLEQFAMLATGEDHLLSSNGVRSLRLESGLPYFWSNRYSIKLKAYAGRGSGARTPR